MSYALYIGKNHTSDGVPYLAGYGDEPSSHWLEIVPRRAHAADAMVTVGVTAESDFPGALSQIPQVPETARHIRVSYSHFRGVPAPLTNGGLNEYGVAVRDVWSASKADLNAMTPKTQSGPNYSDLARLVLERAKSAREGVELIGDLIARYGHSTYGGNSHLIADAEEGWVVIQFSGGQGLWAAERLGPDSIRASRPGYIGDIPFKERHPDFLYSPNLISFAVAQGWFDPDKSDVFNANAIYGDGLYRWAGVSWIEDEMKVRAKRPQKISFEDIAWAIRTPKLTGDTAGYGQIVPLRHPRHDALRVLWHTQIGALAAPFVPVHMGVRDVPEEYRMHRYLTDGESANFIDLRKPDKVSLVPQQIEATRSAAQVFKRLLYVMLQEPDTYLPEVTAVWEGVERKLRCLNDSVGQAAEALISAGKTELAGDYLTYFTQTELLNALNMAETLANALEVRTRALHSFKPWPQPKAVEQTW
ncbi:C69 family dipeptidase [Aestuariivirga sp. YIM B02566]|uniref:C69 family dipeptidase n=1 Tax=Taklimakanibacter albus TaxID=2800327 RepID=A0ACC5QXH7_9HYPH|nr:C69 family dipeptidase [Aestuariivirga sp. YIM B02566]MBK1865068.1 C69 family dipeptidase [Aestuariivirga sp. YIM B02566]